MALAGALTGRSAAASGDATSALASAVAVVSSVGRAVRGEINLRIIQPANSKSLSAHSGRGTRAVVQGDHDAQQFLPGPIFPDQVLPGQKGATARVAACCDTAMSQAAAATNHGRRRRSPSPIKCPRLRGQ